MSSFLYRCADEGKYSFLEAGVSGRRYYIIVKYEGKDAPKIMLLLTQIMKYVVI